MKKILVAASIPVLAFALGATAVNEPTETLVLFVTVPKAPCKCLYVLNAADSIQIHDVPCPAGGGGGNAAQLNTSNYTKDDGDCDVPCAIVTDHCNVSYKVEMTWVAGQVCRNEVWVKHIGQAPPGCEKVDKGNDDISHTVQGTANCKPDGHDDTFQPGCTDSFQVFPAATCAVTTQIAESKECFKCFKCKTQ